MQPKFRRSSIFRGIWLEIINSRLVEKIYNTILLSSIDMLLYRRHQWWIYTYALIWMYLIHASQRILSWKKSCRKTLLNAKQRTNRTQWVCTIGTVSDWEMTVDSFFEQCGSCRRPILIQLPHTELTEKIVIFFSSIYVLRETIRCVHIASAFSKCRLDCRNFPRFNSRSYVPTEGTIARKA